MAKEANRMILGGFVVIAFFLLIASIVVFGSGRFFKKTDTYVLYFDGSIKGLNVGAPVLFQGVQVGSVSKIVLRAHREKLAVEIPVYIEIDPNRFMVVGKKSEQSNSIKPMSILIDKGLRAELSMQSFITGQLLIELDFHPGTPINLKDTDPEYVEVPTIPSTTERIYQTLEEINFKAIAEKLENTLSGFDKLVNDPELRDGIRSLRVSSDELRELMGKIAARMDPLIDNVQGTFGDTRKLVNNLDRNIQPMTDDLKKTIEHFDNLVREADASLVKLSNKINKTLDKVGGVVSEDAPLVANMEDALRDLSAMANAIRQLVEYLEQHPESLIQGKSLNGEK